MGLWVVEKVGSWVGGLAGGGWVEGGNQDSYLRVSKCWSLGLISGLGTLAHHTVECVPLKPFLGLVISRFAKVFAEGSFIRVLLSSRLRSLSASPLESCTVWRPWLLCSNFKPGLKSFAVQ